jgi:putative drug exporter of the RND superfamily
MLFLAKFSIRRPRVALVSWLAVAAVLTLIGLGVSSTLSPSITVVPGTQSSRATQLANATFGPSQLIPIMLEGPKAQLDKQGPNLVRALAKRPYTRVLSAWDAGTASAGLRPRPTAAMMVVSVDRSEKNVVQYDEPQIESLVAHQVTGPVKAFVTGRPSIDRAERTASISNLRSTELIAIGILFLLLLIGLRAPVAAAIVAATGAISMLSGFGEVALLGHLMAVDPVGIAAGSMTGLALGVGFALMILDRFHREEFPDGAPARDAVTAATVQLKTTGRALLVGGSALILALLVVAAIGPTQLIVSGGVGMIASSAFAIGGAVVVMPAALVLLGRRIDAFSFPAPAPLTRVWSALVSGGNVVTRYAAFAGFFATLVLAAIAIPAFALNSGPESVKQLPASSKARIAFTEISRVMGPGWATPYNVIIVANNRPITTPALLASIYRFETKIAQDKTVSSVSGPGQINSTSNQLKAFGPGLKHSVKISDQSKTQLLQLINGLKQAGVGSAQLQSGLASASSGAGLLNSGSGTAQSGAGQLHAGLAQAKTGSATLASGLGTALNAANQLKAGAGQALSGATQLASGLGKGAPQVKAGLPAVATLASDTLAAMNQIKETQGDAQGAQSSVTSALAALNAMSTGKSDPKFQQLQAALRHANSDVGAVNNGLGGAATSASGAAFIASGVKSQVDALAPQLTAAASGAAQLEAGLVKLRNGNAQLAAGMSQLAGGGGTLTNGLSQLTAGAGALQIGLGQLTNGTGQLYSGLASGVSPAGQLTTGLGTMQAAVIKSRGQIPSTASIKALEQQSPGIFNSGYFVLSAVAGSTPSNRNAATFTINLLRGGTAGQVLVISKYAFSDPRAQALGNTLANLGTTFARHNNVQIAVGGPAGSLGDLTSVTKSKIPLDIALLTLAIALVLGLALRAVLLPAVATVFSLLVAGSTFGILQLLFGGSNPPLGGPGYLNPITIISVFTIVFGVTIIYSTLLLMQTRDAYISEPGVRHAVRKGLRQTAAATTGSGLVMAAAVIPFATTDLINVRQLGIGVVVAILLEILIVRPVLLPAAEAVLGRAGWWPTSTPGPTDGTGPDPVTGEPDRGATATAPASRPLAQELDDAPARVNGVPTPA